MRPIDQPDVRQAFAKVQEAPAEVRLQLLAELPEELRLEVESLLEALENADVLPFAEEPQPGDHIGAYVLHEELGQGGMGIVFRAERQDGEYSREVAMKIAGGRMFAPEAQRRFIEERQILARLDHPNIVRMFDGGVFRGQRYLVMELVRGSSITEYARGLAVQERLRLFLQVCSAVQSAHQNLILHRDLKAGNILVTREGTVKVLDFGIARLLGAEGVEAAHTSTHPFSLACASPEQLRGEPLSLASDVYALGLLLYELVAGENPQYRAGSSLQQVLDFAASQLPALSSANPEVSRDLDAVAWKALARDPRERYASVADLERDVRSYLTGHPVSAVPPSLLYRLRRFIHRNRSLSAMTAAALVATFAGAVVYVRDARREQRRFEQARQLVRAVVFDIQPKLASIPATLPLRKTLIDETLRYLEGLSQDTGRDAGLIIEIARAYRELAHIQGPGNAASMGDQAGAVRSFERAREMGEAALALRPKDYELLLSAAGIHQSAATYLAGIDIQVAQADSERGSELAKRAFELRPNERRSREAYALSLFSRAGVLKRSNLKASSASYKAARELYGALARDYSVHRRNVALASRYLVSNYLQIREIGEALELAKAAFQISEQLLAEAPDGATAQFDFAVDASQLGDALGRVEGPEAALPYLEKAVRMREMILARDPANVRARERAAAGYVGYGNALLGTGRLAEARGALNRSAELFSRLIAEGKLENAALRGAVQGKDFLGDLEWNAGRLVTACRLYDEASELIATASRSKAFVEDHLRQAVNQDLQRCGKGSANQSR